MKKARKIILSLFVILLVGCSKDTTSTTKLTSEEFYELNESCIEVEEKKMNSETVQLIVKTPNYTLLYQAASKTENPEQFIQNALENHEYETCKNEIQALVTTEENGEKVIHKEEAIKEILEKEFNDAINALLED